MEVPHLWFSKHQARDQFVIFVFIVCTHGASQLVRYLHKYFNSYAHTICAILWIPRGGSFDCLVQGLPSFARSYSFQLCIPYFQQLVFCPIGRSANQRTGSYPKARKFIQQAVLQLQRCCLPTARSMFPEFPAPLSEDKKTMLRLRPRVSCSTLQNECWLFGVRLGGIDGVR